MDVVGQIVQTAQTEGLDPRIAIEVATEESGLNPNTPDSSRGAIGLFQLLPATATELGVNPRDPVENITGGVRYLKQLLGQFGDLPTALAAYNWGQGNVRKAVATWGSGFLSHAPAETKGYVSRIMAALGTAYQATLTPASIVNGAINTVTQAMPNGTVVIPAKVPIQALLVIGGVTLGAYLLADWLND